MKLLIIVVVILLLGAGYFLIAQRSSKTSPQTPVGEKAPARQSSTLPSQRASFNTNDNLDEALQDLGQLDKF